MNFSCKQTLLNEIAKLVEEELYDSAEIMCSLYVSYLNSLDLKQQQQINHSSNETVSHMLSDMYEKLGDIILKKTEIKRSLHYYRLASQQRKSSQVFKYRNQAQISSTDDARIRYKECSCLFKLRDFSTALNDLESVPAKFRDVKINILLGDLYKNANRRRNAIISYKEALIATPLAIEIIEKLINLGVEASEITTTIEDASRYNETAQILSNGWYHNLILALVNKRNLHNDKSIQDFQKLSIIYPKNNYILLNIADLSLEINRPENTLSLYQQVRKHDGHIVYRMEDFGKLLYTFQDTQELCKLVDDLLDSAPHYPVGWLLAAMYAALKGDVENVVTFIDKSVRLDPTFTASYKFKGNFYKEQGSFDQALIAYSQANSIEKDIVSFSGLVQTNLSLGKVRDAVTVAREAVSNLPRSSEAYLLLGQVYMKSSQNISESLSAYAKALQLNPLSTTAAMAMSELLLVQGKKEEVTECLLTILNKKNCSKLRLKLGKAYIDLGKYEEAMDNLQLAISQKAQDPAIETEALQEIEKIETILRSENKHFSEEEVVEEEDIVNEDEDEDEDIDFHDVEDHNNIIDDDDELMIHSNTSLNGSPYAFDEHSS